MPCFPASMLLWMHITRFLPTLLTWSRVDIVSSCRESPETNWEDDFLLLSDVFPTAYHATEPTDCKGGLFAFSDNGHSGCQLDGLNVLSLPSLWPLSHFEDPSSYLVAFWVCVQRSATMSICFT